MAKLCRKKKADLSNTSQPEPNKTTPQKKKGFQFKFHSKLSNGQIVVSFIVDVILEFDKMPQNFLIAL